MRILIITQHYWPEHMPINTVSFELAAAGNTVDVLTGQPNYPMGVIFEGYGAFRFARESIRDKVTIYRTPMVPRGSGGGMRLFINYLSFMTSATLFGPLLLRGNHYDVMLVFASSPILQAVPGVLLRKLKRAPLVLWVQDLWPESLEATGHVRNRLALSLVRTMVRWIYRRSDLILVQSVSFIKPVLSLAGGTDVTYHPNTGMGVSGHDEHAKSPPRAGFRVVFAGNLGTAQSLETIVDAAQILQTEKNITFVLIGDGVRRAWLESEIAGRRLTNISLLGRFPPEAMPEVFADASALLVTLKDAPIFGLTLPSKVQAYLAAGRPIVASISGEGARVIREAGAGVVCPPEDGAALAQAIASVANSSERELAAMGRSGREYYQEHFDAANLMAKLLHHLRAVAGRVKLGNGD